MPARDTTAPTLGPWRTVGYAVGDFGFNLFFTFCNLFLLYYYTDVLGIGAGLAGGIIMAALVIEGAVDPLIGAVANRTRTRFGRYRPWILFGSAPLCLSFAAMFAPLTLTGTALIVYTAVAHLVFRIAYTLVGIPYAALSAQLTTSSRERSSLAGARMMFAILCALTLAAASLPLAAAFGGGRIGFLKLGCLYAACAFAILMVSFLSTREAANVTEREPSLAEAARALRGNPPFQLVMWALVTASIGSTMAGKALVYYMKYVVGSEKLVTTALTLSAGTAVVALPLWVLLTPRIGKRRVWLASAAIATVQGITWYLTAPGAGPLLWALLCAGGAAAAGIALTFWSAVADTVEFGQWRTGIRAEGSMYGLVTLAQKVALGVGVGLLGVLLDLIGYRHGVIQDAGTRHGILLLVSLAPAALAATGGLLMWFYPIDFRLHGRLTRALARRARAPA